MCSPPSFLSLKLSAIDSGGDFGRRLTLTPVKECSIVSQSATLFLQLSAQVTLQTSFHLNLADSRLFLDARLAPPSPSITPFRLSIVPLRPAKLNAPQRRSLYARPRLRLGPRWASKTQPRLLPGRTTGSGLEGPNARVESYSSITGFWH